MISGLLAGGSPGLQISSMAMFVFWVLFFTFFPVSVHFYTVKMDNVTALIKSISVCNMQSSVLNDLAKRRWTEETTPKRRPHCVFVYCVMGFWGDEGSLLVIM